MYTKVTGGSPGKEGSSKEGRHWIVIVSYLEEEACSRPDPY